MDRQRGLSQPRLQGLGAGLGVGAVASRQPSSQLKTGLPSSLTGTNHRTGSLGSGIRLGSATVGSLGSALPLRSLPRPSPEPACAPVAAAAAASPLTAELSKAVPTLTQPPLTDPKLEPEPGASRHRDMAASGRSGAAGGGGGVADGQAQLQSRWLGSTPAAGLLGRPGPTTSGGLSGSVGAAGCLPLRSIAFSGGGGTPGAFSSGAPPRSSSERQPQGQMQWLPPAPDKPAAMHVDAPKPAKKKARAAKQVQWALPDKEQQKEEQEQQEHHEGLEQPGGPDVACVEPPAKRPRLESLAAMAAGPTAARQRLGRLNQPVLSAGPAAPPPLQALSPNTPAGLHVGGPLTHGSAQQQPGNRARRSRGEEGRTAGDDARRAAHGAASAGDAVPALATLTAADWAGLQRSLEEGADGSPAARVAALKALLVYSATSAPPSPRPSPPSLPPCPPSPQQQQQRTEEHQQQRQVEGQQGQVGGQQRQVEGQQGHGRERTLQQRPGVPVPGSVNGASVDEDPPSGLGSDPGGHRGGPPDPACPRAPGSESEPGSPGTGGPHDWGPDAGSSPVVTDERRPAGRYVGEGMRGTADRTAMPAVSAGGWGAAGPRLAPAGLAAAAVLPGAAAAAAVLPGAVEVLPEATTYSSLQAALLAHPGVVCALWRLVTAGMGPRTAAAREQDGDRDGGDGDGDGSDRSDAARPRRRPPTPPPLAAQVSTAAAAETAGRATVIQRKAEDTEMLADVGSGGTMEANGGGPGPAPQKRHEEQHREQHREASLGRPTVPAADDSQPPRPAADGAAAAAAAAVAAAATDPLKDPRVTRPPPLSPAVRGAWASCAVAVLRNLAVADMVPEQLLCGMGLETCAAVLAEAVLPGRRPHLEDLAASVLELLTALPHHLYLRAPPSCAGEGDAAAAPGGVVVAAPAVASVAVPSGGAAAAAAAAAATTAVEAALAAAAAVCFASAEDGDEQQQEPEQERPGGGGAGAGEESSGEERGYRPGQLRPTGRAGDPQASPQPPPPLLLLEVVVRVLADGPEGPLRLRALAAGLLAAWLGVPAHQPAVLTALSAAPPLHLPPPPRAPAPPREAGALEQQAAAPAAAAPPTSAAAESQPAPPSSQSSPPAAGGRPAPLDALAELLCLDRLTAKAAAGREAAALAADAAAAGPRGARPLVVPTKDFLKLLAAWRRSDAVASAVEVLYALACDCGPAGRRLLAAHPELLRGLAVLAAAAAERLQSAARAPPPPGGGGGAQGDVVSARSRATLVAAAEVAGDILAALREEGITW